MANEFKHVSVGGDLSQSEWEAVSTHIADGQTAGDILYFDGTYWKRRPYNMGARVYHSTAQTIPDNTWTVLAFDSERWDTDSIHDNVTNNSRLTCKTAGKYMIEGQVRFDASTVGDRALKITLNGTDVIVLQQLPPTPSGGWVNQVLTIYNLNVNDYVEFLVLQSSGGNLDVTVNALWSPEFMMQRIG
jgi:hypothetical protein